MLTEEECIEIARHAIAGKVDLQEGAPIKVERRDKKYIVTFVHNTPSHMLGPDYDARITIDAESGEVIEILGAP